MDLFKLFGVISINNSDANDALDETSKKGQQTESKLSKAFSGIGKGAAVVGKAVGVGMIAAGTAVVGLVTKSTQAYAEYEQLVGGVDTLFKESSAKVQAYAERAYETAGMSANEYMTTVTSFSASLLQSLGGDTEKAADKADMAITDMSDNANKMGTSMEMIQNAYNGFAKQNYTMLDNLKLGYGGTKEEMQRLLDDAEKLSGQKFDISSYADVVDAIHVVQTEMGITGTTAEEAAGTISGSMSSVKGAWTNLVTAMSSDDLPLDEYIDKFVNSATTMVSNMLPRIQTALGGVVKLVNQLAPVIIGKIPELFSQLLPSVIEAATGLVSAIVNILPDLIQALLDMLPAFIDGLVQILNAIIRALPQVVQALVSALPTLMPIIIDALVSLIITICEVLPQIIQPIIDYLPMIIESICTALIENLPQLMESGKQLLMGLLEGMIALVGKIPEILGIIWDSIVNGIKALFGIHSPSTVMAEIGKNIMEGLINGIKNLVSKCGEVLKSVWEGVKNVFSNVGGWFKGKFSEAWEGVKNVFSGVSDFFSGIWEKIKNTFSALGTKISDSISGAVKSGINNLIGSAENIINGFFKLVNGAIDMINKIPNVNISKIKLVEFQRLAKGGVVDKPTPAIFGEDGAEAVVPLENNTGWINKIALKLQEFNLKTHNFLDGGVSVKSIGLQQTQASELQTLNATNNKLLEAILRMDENMGGNLKNALEGMSFDMNKREFARLVKEVG